MFERSLKFVRRYGNVRETVSRAAQACAHDVRIGCFPSSDEIYFFKDKRLATDQ